MRTGLPELSATFPELTQPWEILSTPSEWSSEELQLAWKRLLPGRSGVTAVYQTPGWFDHIASIEWRDRVLLAVTRDRWQRIAGIAPVRLSRRTLDFHLKGRALLRLPMLKASLVGGRPLAPDNPTAMDRLFESIAGALPDADAIALSGVEADSFLWRYLHSSETLNREFLVFIPEGPRPYHLLDLPATFDDYLALFNAKKRYNLNRQLKILRQQGEGRLELHCIDSPAGAGRFLDAQSRMEDKEDGSWGRAPRGSDICHWSRSQVADMARRGFLRSYVLTCGNDPVSMIKGIQHRSTYFALQTLYRKEYAAFSPGACILHLAIEDLLAQRPVRRIEFGFGEPNQKHHTANATIAVASVLLMRKTPTNRLRAALHEAFFSTIRLAKKIRDDRGRTGAQSLLRARAWHGTDGLGRRRELQRPEPWPRRCTNSAARPKRLY